MRRRSPERIEKTLDEREKGEETKFSLDQETLFRVRVRHYRILARHVAKRLGHDKDGAETYARGMVEKAMEGTDVVARLADDLLMAGRDPEKDLTPHINTAWTEARESVEAEMAAEGTEDSA